MSEDRLVLVPQLDILCFEVLLHNLLHSVVLERSFQLFVTPVAFQELNQLVLHDAQDPPDLSVGLLVRHLDDLPARPLFGRLDITRLVLCNVLGHHLIVKLKWVPACEVVV